MKRFPSKWNYSTRNILLLKKTEEKWQPFFANLPLVNKCFGLSTVITQVQMTETLPHQFAPWALSLY